MSDERRTPEGNLALEQAYKERDRYRREAAASAAREAMLRKALDLLLEPLRGRVEAWREGSPPERVIPCQHAAGDILRASRALTLPSDTSALDAVRAAERERVAGLLYAQGEAIVVHGQELYGVGSKALAYHFGARDEWRAAAKFVRALGPATAAGGKETT